MNSASPALVDIDEAAEDFARPASIRCGYMMIMAVVRRHQVGITPGICSGVLANARVFTLLTDDSLKGLSNSANQRMALTRTNWPDVDDVVALNADTEVMRYLDHGRPMTPARVLAEEMPRLMAHNGRADRLALLRVTAGRQLSWLVRSHRSMSRFRLSSWPRETAAAWAGLRHRGECSA
jgi:hypothetical protein